MRAFFYAVSRRPTADPFVSSTRPLGSAWCGLALLLVLLSACGGPATARERDAQRAREHGQLVASEVDARALRRRLWRVDPRSEEARTLRSTLATYIGARAKAAIRTDDYDAVIAGLTRMASLYTPDTFESESLSPAFLPLADYLLREGSPRGDEAAVLAALWIKRALAKDAAERAKAAEDYEALLRWGSEVRSTLGSEVARVSGLIEVATKQVELTPATSHLRRLTTLIAQRRAHIVAFLKDRQSRESLSAPQLFQQHRQALPLLARAPLDMASVFLRHGDTRGAIREVRKLEDTGPSQGRLVAALQAASEAGERGLTAQFELATAFLDTRAEVSEGLCRAGLRRAPEDPRFPACLARVAVKQSRPDDAATWYGEAVALAPESRALYDEALERMASLIQRGLFSSDPGQARVVADRAERLLSERLKRWKDIPPSVAPSALYLLFGILDTNAGKVEAAREHFRESIALEASADAYFQLGLLELRLGNAATSRELLKQAVEVAAEHEGAAPGKRAELFEQLAEATRRAEGTQKAQSLYREALALWQDAGSDLEGPGLAMFHVRRGIIHDRLGDLRASQRAFQAAMDASPGWREPYASLLSHVAVRQPDLALSRYVFRQANRQLTLEPEWKVYFALWVRMIALRAGSEVPSEVAATLKELSVGPGWWARLARFASGDWDADTLLDAASNRGERAEASFYAAIDLLARGDADRARKLLEAVLSTKMVSYYEYVMATEILATL